MLRVLRTPRSSEHSQGRLQDLMHPRNRRSGDVEGKDRQDEVVPGQLVYIIGAPFWPLGPSTQYLRTLVPKTLMGMVFGTRVLKCWVLGPSGWGSLKQGS